MEKESLELILINVDDFVKIWNNPDEVPSTTIHKRMETVKFLGEESQIVFTGLKIKGELKIQGNNKPLKPIRLHNCSIENIRFQEAKLSKIVFTNSNVQNFTAVNSNIEDLHIKASHTKDLYFHKNSNINIVDFEDSTTGFVYIEDSLVKDLRIWSDSKIGDLHIEGSTILYSSLIKAHIHSMYVWFNSRIEKIDLNDASLPYIEIDKNSIVEFFKCKFKPYEPLQLWIKNSKIISLSFYDCILSEMTNFTISEGSEFNEIKFLNVRNNGSIFFNSVKSLKRWNIHQKFGDGRFKSNENGDFLFNEVEKDSLISFTDSDLGKIQFIDCDLTQFDRFEFQNSKMLDVFVAGTKMPTAEAFHLPEGSTANLEEQKRLAFGQFKRIYEARGDKVSALQYLAYEMNAYWKQLRNEKIKGWNNLWDNWSEQFILFLNWLSTSYGNNWARGALITFIFIELSFFSYCWLLGYIPSFDKDGLKKFWELFSHSLVYLNPFRDEDSGGFYEVIKKDGLKITPPARIWDYFSRVVVAYFVYQTIQSFRKLGKSSG